MPASSSRASPSPKRCFPPRQLSPIRTRKWQVTPEFSVRTTTSHLDTALWFAAHEDHKFRPLACLRAQRLVRNDQRGTRGGHLYDTIHCILWNGDPIERRFRTG